MSLNIVIDDDRNPALLRSIGLWQVTFYAVGGMLGAGIYGLIGYAAAELGSAIWRWARRSAAPA